MDAVGSRIPDFRAPASTGQTLEASSFVGSLPMVLMLMPDPICEESRSQLHAANHRLADFASERVQLLAVTRSTAGEVRRCAAEEGIDFPLLADPASDLSRAIGEVELDGTPIRISLITNALGTIVDAVAAGDDMAAHVDEVITRVRDLGDALRLDPQGLADR